MSVATKRKLVKRTVLAVDATLKEWQEAFGRGDCEPRECAPVVDALLELRHATTELVKAK